jgi:hypothetical protein
VCKKSFAAINDHLLLAESSRRETGAAPSDAPFDCLQVRRKDERSRVVRINEIKKERNTNTNIRENKRKKEEK